MFTYKDYFCILIPTANGRNYNCDIQCCKVFVFLNNVNQEVTILNATFLVVGRVGVEGEGFVPSGGGVGWETLGEVI